VVHAASKRQQKRGLFAYYSHTQQGVTMLQAADFTTQTTTFQSGDIKQVLTDDCQGEIYNLIEELGFDAVKSIMPKSMRLGKSGFVFSLGTNPALRAKILAALAPAPSEL